MFLSFTTSIRGVRRMFFKQGQNLVLGVVQGGQKYLERRQICARRAEKKFLPPLINILPLRQTLLERGQKYLSYIEGSICPLCPPFKLFSSGQKHTI